jgi:hypothetical protein
MCRRCDCAWWQLLKTNVRAPFRRATEKVAWLTENTFTDPATCRRSRMGANNTALHAPRNPKNAIISCSLSSGIMILISTV